MLQEDQARALVIAPLWSLVSKDVSNVNQPASTSTEGGLPSPVTTRQDQTAPSVAQISTDVMSLVRRRLRQQNISGRAETSS